MNASRDDNRVTTLLGTLNTDGVTVIPLKVNSGLHALNIQDGTTGSGLSATTVQRDGNRATAIWGVSSVDGVTPVEIWCDSLGNLLVNST